MPRLRTTPDDLENPLQRMFGAFLRTERLRLELSSAEVAKRLHISDTYLRLVEAGGATLNQSLILKIIEVFADSKTQTHDTRTIHFDRLALFMVGLHWVGAEMTSMHGKEAGRSALENLADRVSDFQRFYEKTKRYFEYKESTQEQKAFLEKVAAVEVGQFLRTDAYGREDLKSIKTGIMPVEELLDLPTLNIDILLDLKRSLADRSFVHTGEIASKWESNRAAQFRSVSGLYRSPKLIINEANLDRFHYDYLSQEGFAELRMMFLDADASEANLKATFIKGIERGRRNAGVLGPLTQKDRDKIRFSCLPPDKESADYKAALDILRRRDTVGTDLSASFEAYWSFEMISGLQIGFIGVLDGNAENTRNLNLHDSVHKAQQFKKLWSALNEAR